MLFIQCEEVIKCEGLYSTSYELRVVSCELVFSHILRVASCELRAASCKLVLHHINSFYTFVLILDSSQSFS